MATFAEIQTRVQSHVIDVSAALETELPNLVNDVIRDMQMQHNWRIMEGTEEFTTTEDSHTLGTISDFKEIRERPWLRLGDGGDHEIEWAATHAELVKLFSLNDSDADRGEPEYVFLASIDEDNAASLEVYPFPDGASEHSDSEYRVNVPYWKFLPALSADGETNWFTKQHEQYVLYASTASAFFFNEAYEKAAVWIKRAAPLLHKAIRQDKRSRSHRSGALVPRVDAFAPRDAGLKVRT